MFDDSSLVRHLLINLMASGSSPALSLTCNDESRQLSNSRRRNHKVWTHNEKRSGYCPIGVASYCLIENLK